MQFYTLKGNKSHIHHSKNPNLMKVTYALNRLIKATFTPLLTEAYPPKRHGFLYAQQRYIKAAHLLIVTCQRLSSDFNEHENNSVS